MTTTFPIPLALFDELEFFSESAPTTIFHREDFLISKNFLLAYQGSKETFKTYRREVERFLQWSWLIKQKKLNEIDRTDVENFLDFCAAPPASWIGLKRPPRFIVKDGQRIQNTEWRPFVASVSKAEHKKAILPNKKNYHLSNESKKSIFAVLSTFFNFLIIEGYLFKNPVIQIRQKSRFIQKQQSKRQIRRLTKIQWEYIIKTAKEMADENPQKHERTLFLMSILYLLYPRISELTEKENWTPVMCHFFRDYHGDWWFKVLGKGNKLREIAVGKAMLEALKHWRKHLGLTPELPSPNDNSPLLPKTLGSGAISSISYLRKTIQGCFDAAINKLRMEGHKEEADAMLSATVHWLRHTGISEDAKTRPLIHVRDDAGHNETNTTGIYIEAEAKARHDSAQEKQLE